MNKTRSLCLCPPFIHACLIVYFCLFDKTKDSHYRLLFLMSCTIFHVLLWYQVGEYSSLLCVNKWECVWDKERDLNTVLFVQQFRLAQFNYALKLSADLFHSLSLVSLFPLFLSVYFPVILSPCHSLGCTQCSSMVCFPINVSFHSNIVMTYTLISQSCI